MRKRLAILLLLPALTQAQTDGPLTNEGAKTTTLQIVNARSGEIYPISSNPQDKISFQGNAVENWQSKIAAIHINKITPWTTPPTRQGFAAVETVATCPLESDGSVLCQIPCGIDYQLRGIDSAGNVVAEDNSLHHSVCGEVTTCHGCHDGHGAERLATLPPAAEAWAKTIAGKK